MNTKRSFLWSLLLGSLLGFMTLPASAQVQTMSVVISELLLNREQPARSWVELYNPSDTTIVVKYFRLSHIKTPSILPPDVNRLGGISLSPGQYVVLCADTEQFTRSYGSVAGSVEVPLLKSLADGGFLGAGTKLTESTATGMVRYGCADYSSNVAGLAGSQLVSFLNDGRSHARKVTNSPSGYHLSSFIEGSPTPGRSNN